MRVYKRPTDQSSKEPPPPERWRFTERDQAIVKTIPHYEGFLSIPIIQDLFFGNGAGGNRQAKKRVEYLCRAQYLVRPSRPQRYELPEAIVWLSKKGDQFCAENGAGFWQTVKRKGELVERHVHVKKPNFLKIHHDLMVNEFHKDVDLATRYFDLQLRGWLPSYLFERESDLVEYVDSKGNHRSRRYRPDSAFMLEVGAHEKRFLLEMDRGGGSKFGFNSTRVLNEKILLFPAYVDSKAYRDRFGQNAGRQLIVTTGQERLENLIEKTALHLGNKAQFILFTIFEHVQPETVLTEPIWWRYQHKINDYEAVRLADA